MNFLTQFRWTILALIAGLVIGFGSGWYVKGKFYRAAQVEQTQKAFKGTAKEIVNAIDRSRDLDATIEKKREQQDDIKQVAVARAVRISKKENKNEPVPSCSVSSVQPTIDQNEMRFVRHFDTDGHLDVGTVRLLNAAAEGKPLEPISISDAESEAPSEATGEDLLSNSFEIRKLYNELSDRHNALVTEVEEQLRKQAQ